MYAASNAFHRAVANGAEQRALLIFSDCIFTDSDISVEEGIEFRDYFNTSEDLSIGQANSNELSFGLFNDARLLNNYKFGDFTALLGVRTGESGYVQSGTATILSTRLGNRYDGYAEYPYLRRNGTALAVQPSFAVRSLLCYEDKIYAFGANRQYAVYADASGENITRNNSVNSFMRTKSIGWSGKGIYYNKSTKNLFLYENGARTQYEFVPLGCFTAERPKVPDVIQIDMNCNDYMLKFDQDMPTDSALGVSYPITLGNLLKKLCDYVGVDCKSTTFTNSTARVSTRPDDFDNATMRDVVKWIAEAAGSNARFDRDGKLEMAWLRTTSQSYEATNYSDFSPTWYETKKVTKLYNRSTQEGTDHTYGSGSEGYLIQDNPLLKGVT